MNRQLQGVYRTPNQARVQRGDGILSDAFGKIARSAGQKLVDTASTAISKKVNSAVESAGKQAVDLAEGLANTAVSKGSQLVENVARNKLGSKLEQLKDVLDKTTLATAPRPKQPTQTTVSQSEPDGPTLAQDVHQLKASTEASYGLRNGRWVRLTGSGIMPSHLANGSGLAPDKSNHAVVNKILQRMIDKERRLAKKGAGRMVPGTGRMVPGTGRGMVVPGTSRMRGSGLVSI